MAGAKFNWISYEASEGSECHVLTDFRPKENQVEQKRRRLIYGLFKQYMYDSNLKKKETGKQTKT